MFIYSIDMLFKVVLLCRLALRTLTILGSKTNNLCAMMPQNYLTSSVERDPNASAPSTNKLQYTRLATVKEGPGGGINPHSLKYTLDQVDAEVDARANHSRASDNTSFPVTWTWLWCQNGDFKVKASLVDAAAGMTDKIVELRPPFHFVDKPADQLAANERLVDPVYKDSRLYKDPQWIAEVVFFARCVFKLHSLNRNRTTHPLPPHSLSYRKSSNVELRVDLIYEWIKENLRPCSRQDADPINVIEKELLKLPNVDRSVLTSAGLGSIAKSRRRSGHAGNRGDDYIYVIAIKPGDEKTPVQLKARPM